MSEKMMKAAQLLGKQNLKINMVPKPKINKGEILLKVKAASICGTDVRMYKNGYTGVDEDHPLTLGHEVSGIIEEVGSGVTGYKEGMRVSVAPNMGCGICDLCVSGNTHLCENYQAFGINLPGGFAEYLKIPDYAIRQGNITPLHEDISFEEAALIEPFSCVFNGQEISSVNAGDTVLIIGSGPIGIMHAMLALSRGASKIIMNDLVEERLEMSKKIVPELVTFTGDNLKEKIMHETNNRGVDLCIVAAPSPQAQKESFQYMAVNGRVLFFGGLPKEKENVPLNTNILHYKQLRVFGCTRANLNSYRISEKMIASGRIPVAKLITQRFSINEFMEAMSAAEKAIGLKNVILFDE